jgi:hypothetical protein
MSEVFTPKMIETGRSIARRGAELSRLAKAVTGIFHDGELAGAIGGLGRQAAREQEIRKEQIGVIGEAELLLGSVSHDKWRKENFSTGKEGVYEPRIKCLVEREDKDVWVNMDGLNDGEDVLFAQDIANTNFEDLHPHWQKDNFEAAKVVVAILVENNGVIDLEDPEARQSAGTKVNEDISQVRTALALFPRQ